MFKVFIALTAVILSILSIIFFSLLPAIFIASAFGLLLGMIWSLENKIAKIEARLDPKQPFASAANHENSMPIKKEKRHTPPPLSQSSPKPTTQAKSPGIIAHFINHLNITRIGVILLFLGITFLLKYASEIGILSLEMRFMLVIMGSFLLLWIGWHLRKHKLSYALLLQGAGIGIFYLAVFTGCRLYQLLPYSLTFILLIFAVAFSTILALLQESKALAIFGIIGGFLAPILVATGNGGHIALFSYYAILNTSILAVSFFRLWNSLNLVGFVFTFLIGSIWGFQFYTPELFYSVEPFLVLFFLIYFTISLLHERKNLIEKNKINGVLLFSLPIITFLLQSSLVKDNTYGLAFSAMAFAGFYIIMTKLLWTRHGNSLQALITSYLSIGICFLTLAFPLTFEGKYIAAIWALESTILIWWGIKQNSQIARYTGIILQVFAALIFFGHPEQNRLTQASLPILNSFFSNIVLFTLSQLSISFFLKKVQKVSLFEKDLASLFFISGLLWWFLGGAIEISNDATIWYHSLVEGTSIVPASIRTHCYLLFLMFSLWLSQFIAHQISWEAFNNLRLFFIPTAIFLTCLLFFKERHPFENIGGFIWPAVFISHYTILRYNELIKLKTFRAEQHTLAIWLLIFLSSWEAYWLCERYLHTSILWSFTMLSIVPSLFVFSMIYTQTMLSWPFKIYYHCYLKTAIPGILAWQTLWLFYLNLTQEGNTSPIIYLPLLNPLDITQLFFLALSIKWFIETKKTNQFLISQKSFLSIIGVVTFVWLTALLIRTLHHWANIPWTAYHLWSSNMLQASLALFWSIIAFALMLFASKQALRTTWIVGMGLLGLVIIKLFLVDLSNTGTLSRVIAFIGTGVLLLLIGYFAPLPPIIQKTSPIKE